MSIFSIFQKRAKTIDQIANEIHERTGGSASGEIVNNNTALQVTAVLACVDAIASGCSVPDLHVMRDLGENKKERAINEPAYRILYRRPNEWQTAFEFREMLTMHAALTGNGIAIPTFDSRGRLSELIPILPGNWVLNTPRRYQFEYQLSDEFGLIGTFPFDKVFHLRNRSWDQIRGLDAVRQARQAIGLSIASEANISKLQANGGRPSGILSTDTKLGQETIDRLKEAFKKASTGRNSFKTAVLDANMKYTPMAMSAIDQETNATRRLQIEEICRAFGVFPQIVMHTDKTATFASAETFFAAHNRLTVGKWQKNWIEKTDEFLLDGSGNLFAEFDNRLFQGASLKDTGEYYAKALGAGGAPPWMTQNEVRAEQGKPPLPGGDELFKPSNAVIEEPENEPDEIIADA